MEKNRGEEISNNFKSETKEKKENEAHAFNWSNSIKTDSRITTFTNLICDATPNLSSPRYKSGFGSSERVDVEFSGAGN